jgi:hypothetical protein
MSVGKLIVDKNRVRAVLVFQSLLHTLDFVVGDLETWPTIPLEAGGFAETTETRDKTSRRHGK